MVLVEVSPNTQPEDHWQGSQSHPYCCQKTTKLYDLQLINKDVPETVDKHSELINCY